MKMNWWPQRGCWRKSLTVDGKKIDKYYKFPKTAVGEELALAKFLADKAELTGERQRQICDDAARRQIVRVQRYFEQFGDETGVLPLIRTVADTLEIPPRVKLWQARHCNIELQCDFSENPLSPAELKLSEIIGVGFPKSYWQLPKEWQQRVSHLDINKESQLIGFWLKQFTEFVLARAGMSIQASTAYSKINHLRPFEEFADKSANVLTINNDFVTRFQSYLNSLSVATGTKDSYYSQFVQFMHFLLREDKCDLVKLPSRLVTKETRFRSTEAENDQDSERIVKQSKLWTPEAFVDALATVPANKKLWLLLALNCGFRNIDIATLKWANIQDGRLIKKRHKSSNHKNAPFINYKLWPSTIEELGKLPRKTELVLTNRKGERLVDPNKKVKGIPRPMDCIAIWFGKNRKRYGLKRFDYLRKTGSTFIESEFRNVEPLYLGHTLRSVAQIHYNFNDGKVIPQLDEAIDALGFEFGQVPQPPKKSMKLSPEALELLRQHGMA